MRHQTKTLKYKVFCLQNNMVSKAKEVITNGEGEKMALNRVAIEAWEEVKKLWILSGPAIVCIVFNFMLSATTQMFAGHLGKSELAGACIANLGIQGIAYGVLIGLASAVQTMCGQAFGAKQYNMLGHICQRAMLITTLAASLLSIVYAFAKPILLAMGQSTDVAEKGAIFAKGLIPQIFAFGMFSCMQRFLMSQKIVIPLAILSMSTFGIHIVMSWVVVYKLKQGLLGAALTFSFSWWFLAISTFLYIIVSPRCKSTWTGFSSKAFQGMWPYFKLTLASASMLCLEIWYSQSLVIFSGMLPDPELAVDSISICMNYWLWDLQLMLGISAAASVRVGNELGAKNPNAARFSVIVAGCMCLTISSMLALGIMTLKMQISQAFTNTTQVITAVSKLTPLLAVSVFLNGVQPLLSAVAIGCGWQLFVAYVNLACYYVIGLPIGLILAFKARLRATGIWWGLICGVIMQTLVLIVFTARTNWKNEVEKASKRLGKSSNPNPSTPQHDTLAGNP